MLGTHLFELVQVEVASKRSIFPGLRNPLYEYFSRLIRGVVTKL
jgi:hypothetical protein